MEKKQIQYPSLVAFIFTKDDVFELIEEIDAMEQELYKSNIQLDTLLSARVSSRFLSPLKEIFAQSVADMTQIQKVHEVLSSIVSELQGLPVVHITLAFDPTQLLQRDIVLWLREKIKEGIILDVIVDKKIVGGFLMDYNGHYWDLSIHSSFEKLFQGGNLIYLVNRK